MLTDEVEVTLKAGHGGAGKVSFYPGEYSGPDGGNGGRGGDVYIKVTSDITALNQYTHNKILKAENGEPGSSFLSSGKAGQDLVLQFPVGSLFQEEATGEQFELTTPEQMILIAKGGLGGRGNAAFKSPRNTTPKRAQPGLEGEEKHFTVILRLIADFGLIGLPNAGKSSLLNEMTSANAKTAAYPFTTLEPNLGVLKIGSPSTRGMILADIPGLIEGASSGKGLGIKFLKHIEKVKVLLHLITAESEDVLRDYRIVRSEMEKFNPELLNKEEIVLLAKTDLVGPEEVQKKIKQLKTVHQKVLLISIHNWDSLEELKKALKV